MPGASQALGGSVEETDEGLGGRKGRAMPE